MKPDQTVNYVDREGVRHDAVILAISGVGSNNYKLLNLRYNADGETVEVEKVPYQDGTDTPENGFWLLKGQHIKKRREPEGTSEEGARKKRKKE